MRPSKRVVTVAVAACLAFAGLGVAAATSQASTCSVALGGSCGPYSDTAIPMSNGYDTYVGNQNVGPNSGTTETVTATDPGNWSLTANAQPYGYTGVQTFPDVQQLTNDWCGNGWGGCANPADTPLGSLSALSVKYAESSPADANSIYEFAPDVWTNYTSDIMFWVDTHGRCGAFGDTVLGTFTMDGQNWTAYRYGGAGGELILVLDGPGGSGTCAEQSSGTIDIKGGLDWLAGKGYIPSPVTISQLNTGWEITSADNQQFKMSDYSITATVNGSAPSPSPSTSSPAPSPSTSSPAPSPSTSSPAPTPTTTQTSTAPAPAPSGLSHSSHVLVDFWWGSVTGAKGYEFELETSTGSVVEDKTVTSPHVSNVEVTKDTKYWWRVRATGGNWSAWKSFTSP